MAQIEGSASLRRKIASLNKGLGLPLLRRMARRAAAVVRDEARRSATFRDRTGKGRRGIISIERRGDATTARFQVGFRKKTAFYLKFIEGGARAHRIDLHGSYLARANQANPGSQIMKFASSNRRKALTIHLGGGPDNILFRRSARHPGIIARPFLVRALRSSETAAVAEAAKLVNDVLLKVTGVGSGGTP